MTFLFIIFAAFLAAIVNLMTKKNMDEVGTSQGYMVIYFLLSFVSSFIVMPEIFITQLYFPMIALGVLVGVLVFLMMWALAKALLVGPPGLTFAFQNGSAITPSVVLYLIFGPAFGYRMTFTLALGLLCVLAGLAWSSYQKPDKEHHYKWHQWAFFAISCFLVHGTILSLFHWRALASTECDPHSLIFIKCTQEQASWFMPGFFLTAAALNGLMFMKYEKRSFLKPEIKYGFIGGLLNGIVTFLLLLATVLATHQEKGIIFPLFAVGVIAFCNLWGQKLYNEKVNWLAILLCIFGILLGTIF